MNMTIAFWFGLGCGFTAMLVLLDSLIGDLKYKWFCHLADWDTHELSVGKIAFHPYDGSHTGFHQTWKDVWRNLR